MALHPLISPFVHILPLSLLIILFGLFLVLYRKNTSGTVIIIIAVFFLYACSLFPVSGWLLHNLQSKYKTYYQGNLHVQYIIVLGGWHKTNPKIPLTSQLGQESLVKIIEGIRIYRKNPGSRLLLSGGRPADDTHSNAVMMARLAISLGVPQEDIILEERPETTAEEAKCIAETIKKAPCVLVTSATHMQRALTLFHQHGIQPIPAPVNFLYLDNIPFSLMPSAKALQISEELFHEYLGLLWARLQRHT